MIIHWYWIAAVIMVVTALVHTIVGEKKLIGPVMQLRDGVLKHDLARQLLRFVWHMTGVAMIGCAIIVAFPQTPHVLNALIGGAWLIAGIIDAVYTRGKHIGWPLLMAAGACALYGALA